jgi:hypothetical protein
MAFRHALILLAIMVPACGMARAAELDGLQLPERVEAAGGTLQLNGYGLRTYSVLGIHIYVAALYLQYPSTDPDEIIHSSETKLLLVKFERNISAEVSRKAWREGLENNCQDPCQLDPGDVARFLSEIPAMHDGDNYSLLFTSHGATITVGGQEIGVIHRLSFADALLATFLGPRPASPKLKHDLLNGHK